MTLILISSALFLLLGYECGKKRSRVIVKKQSKLISELVEETNNYKRIQENLENYIERLKQEGRKHE